MRLYGPFVVVPPDGNQEPEEKNNRGHQGSNGKKSDLGPYIRFHGLLAHVGKVIHKGLQALVIDVFVKFLEES